MSAGADEVKKVDDENGRLFDRLGRSGPAVRLPPDDAFLTKESERDRVAAALGQEVAAEAEHVCPSAQAPPPAVDAAEVPARVD